MSWPTLHRVFVLEALARTVDLKVSFTEQRYIKTVHGLRTETHLWSHALYDPTRSAVLIGQCDDESNVVFVVLWFVKDEERIPLECPSAKRQQQWGPQPKALALTETSSRSGLAWPSWGPSARISYPPTHMPGWFASSTQPSAWKTRILRWQAPIHWLAKYNRVFDWKWTIRYSSERPKPPYHGKVRSHCDADLRARLSLEIHCCQNKVRKDK